MNRLYEVKHMRKRQNPLLSNIQVSGLDRTIRVEYHIAKTIFLGSLVSLRNDYGFIRVNKVYTKPKRMKPTANFLESNPVSDLELVWRSCI